MLRISDPGDERLADYRNVPDPELLLRRGVFVAEGRLVVRRLLTSSRLATRSVMVTGTAHAAIHDVVAGRDVPVFVVPQDVMNTITGYNIHRGCLAIGQRPPTQDWRSLAVDAQRLIVIEQVGDAGNVGSIFRNAAAFAADAVLLGAGCADPLYRKSIRASMAAALLVPFAHAAPWPAALHELAAMGFAVVALTPAGSAPLLCDVVRTTRDERVAIVLGHEGHGVTAEAVDACTHRARIPMARDVDSLNVATAAALALYELAR